MCLIRRLLITSIIALAAFMQTAPSFAATTIKDGRGNQTFNQPPQRVIVLNWDLLEQVLELGIVPIAAPNISGYRNWVAQPAIPDTVHDIGTRAEPNLEQISQLQPDVILAAAPQQAILDALAKIAPVIYLPNFKTEQQAGDVAIAHFKTLAQLFDRETEAQAKLDQMAIRFSQLRAQLSDAGMAHAQVLPIRFSTITTAFAYTKNSTAQYVLTHLGLTTALQLPSKPWGIIQKRIRDFHKLANAYVLYILPFPDEEKMLSSILWKALPFVQQGHAHSVRPVWNYGGAMSMRYMAEEFTTSLLSMVEK